MPRIVSLIASATEIVCALGFEDGLVGRSHECDYPDTVRRLPVCTGPRFEVAGSSRQIDRSVKSILREALSVYRVDADLLGRLRPDLIVTQSLCDVCAVSLPDVECAVSEWIGARPRIVSLDPRALSDVWADIGRVGEAIGARERAAGVIGRLNERVSAISGRARALPDRPTVACIEWIEPLMAAGNWMPELVEMAGGANLFGTAGRHSPWMTWDDLRQKDPEAIVVLPCGFDLARTRQELPSLARQPGWPDLRAVRGRRVFLTDGSQYFNRPGPRLVESLEILAEILHPGAFEFGHEGRGWQRL